MRILNWTLAMGIPVLAVVLAAVYYWWESTRDARKERRDFKRWLKQ